MLQTTAQRVQMQISPEASERIQEEIRRSIDYYRHHRQEIESRLDELDREWTLERAVQTQFSAATIIGTIIASFTGRRAWLLVPALTGTFLLQQSLQGWSPPVPIYRALGVRTAQEIDEERCELIMLREQESG